MKARTARKIYRLPIDELARYSKNQIRLAITKAARTTGEKGKELVDYCRNMVDFTFWLKDRVLKKGGRK